MGSNPCGAAIERPHIFDDGVGYIPLRSTGRRGHVYEGDGEIVEWVKVDAEDFERLARHAWHKTDTGYAARWTGPKKDRYRVRMHRDVLGLVRGDKRQVDHFNRDKLDNRRSNLRIAERGDADNRQNVPARGGVSEHRGVTYDKRRGHWVAQSKCGAARLYRRCGTEEEAAAVARAWRAEHMPFATD